MLTNGMPNDKKTLNHKKNEREKNLYLSFMNETRRIARITWQNVNEKETKTNATKKKKNVMQKYMPGAQIR